MLATDMHQHLWPDEVLRALERRVEVPCASRTERGWLVRLPGEPPFLVDPAEHDVTLRAADVRRAGLDRALVALSSPVGIETLPVEEAEPILRAWNEAARELPAELGWWASVPLAAGGEHAARAADLALDQGAAGVVVGAAALATPSRLRKHAPLLERLQERLAPLFVHPGPAPGAEPPATVEAGWSAPSTRYVADLHAAWHAWAAVGRTAHPGLHVVWAALAGLAPLHAERTTLRGGPAFEAPDPLQFYDTSGYGPRALRAMACAVGTGQLVHGTDRPVVLPPGEDSLGSDAQAGIRTGNVARLLGTAWVAA